MFFSSAFFSSAMDRERGYRVKNDFALPPSGV